jgi:hypothetical protein
VLLFKRRDVTFPLTNKQSNKMKRQLLIITMALLTTSLFAADLDDAKAAAKKLAGTSYSWKSTVQMPENSQGARFQAGPTEGKFAKDGTVCIVMTRGENKTEAFIKGEKAVIKTEDGWKTAEELTQAGGQGGQPNPGMGMARLARTFKSPAAQAESIIDKLKEVKKADGVFAGDMTEAGAKELLTFGRGRPGGQAPEPKEAKGSAKFWIKDGMIAKYEFTVQGKMVGRNDQEQEINRTTTVEIKDVGTTKVEVPEDVSKKL